MAELPTGTLTFVFTDIEGSTRLLDEIGTDAFEQVLDAHHRVLREAIAANDGFELSTAGDSFFAVFERARSAVGMALQTQTGLASVDWPDGINVRVRIGMHTGTARQAGDDYIGIAVHQAARVSSTAYGGQVVATQETRDAAGAPGDGGSWRSLGHHRLKDLGAAIELFQLCHPELEPEFPPLRSLDRVAHNLPIQTSSFLGRDDDLVAGAKLLSSTRLLTVAGPGGTGKTRVAIQLAAEQVDEFPDGVWLAELAPAAPADVASTLMAAMGLREEPGRTSAATIAAHVRHRRALVVLDNCEHVVDAVADLAAQLLHSSDVVRILATSREPLRIAGESVWALPPLAVPDSGETSPEVLAFNDAVALFCERASEASVGFALRPENAAEIAAICVHVDGIPLAIELAAARVRTIPLASIAERLEHSLDVLSKGRRGVDRRQASVRGAVAWSHDLLTPLERTLFRRLAVFAGGFTLEAAEAVCAGDGIEVFDVVDTLDALVDKSLVGLTQGGVGEGRYSLLRLIRTFACERLDEAGERSVVSDRHAAFYADLAAQCDDDDLVTDHPNLLAALEHLAGRDDPVLHGSLLDDLAGFWEAQGQWALARRELLRYVRREDRDGPLATRALTSLGNIAIHSGDYALAGTYLTEGLAMARALGLRSLEAALATSLGGLAAETGDHAGARARYEEALDIAHELDDRSLAAVILLNLGNEAYAVGAYATARRRFAEALEAASDVDDHSIVGFVTGMLGVLAHTVGDFAEAGERLQEALDVARRLGLRHDECDLLGKLGGLASTLGHHEQAVARYSEALGIARALGSRKLEASWLVGLGYVDVATGRHAAARERFASALAIARGLGHRHAEGRALGALGHVERAVGRHAEARVSFEQAVRIAREVGDRSGEADQIAGLGEVALCEGRLDDARAHLEEALASARELGRPANENDLARLLGEVAIEQGDEAEARARLDHALTLSRRLDRPDARTLDACARLLVRVERHHDAAMLLGAVERLQEASAAVRDITRQRWHDETAAACQAALGEEWCKSAWARGHELEWPAVSRSAQQLVRA